MMKAFVLVVLVAALQSCDNREFVADGSTDINVHVTVSDASSQPVGGAGIYLGDLTTGSGDPVILFGTTNKEGLLEVRFPYTWSRRRWHHMWRSDTGDLEVDCAILIASKQGYAPAVARVARFRLDALVSPVIRQHLTLRTPGT